MTWPEFAAARQLLVEEQIGSKIREAKRVEDQTAKATRKRLAQRER